MSVDALEWLRWSREHIAAGEYWRLITGHLVHLGAGHALLNAFGAVIVWTVFREPLSSRLGVWVVLAGFVTVNAGLWFGTELQWYVGASGVLHARGAAGGRGRLDYSVPASCSTSSGRALSAGRPGRRP